MPDFKGSKCLLCCPYLVVEEAPVCKALEHRKASMLGTHRKLEGRRGGGDLSMEVCLYLTLTYTYGLHIQLPKHTWLCWTH